MSDSHIGFDQLHVPSFPLYPGPGAGKAFSGMNLGPPRLPVMPLSMDEMESFRSDLQSIGYFDWA